MFKGIMYGEQMELPFKYNLEDDSEAGTLIYSDIGLLTLKSVSKFSIDDYIMSKRPLESYSYQTIDDKNMTIPILVFKRVDGSLFSVTFTGKSNKKETKKYIKSDNIGFYRCIVKDKIVESMNVSFLHKEPIKKLKKVLSIQLKQNYKNIDFYNACGTIETTIPIIEIYKAGKEYKFNQF